jgi:hypothetical protein
VIRERLCPAGIQIPALRADGIEPAREFAEAGRVVEHAQEGPEGETQEGTTT